MLNTKLNNTQTVKQPCSFFRKDFMKPKILFEFDSVMMQAFCMFCNKLKKKNYKAKT